MAMVTGHGVEIYAIAVGDGDGGVAVGVAVGGDSADTGVAAAFATAVGMGTNGAAAAPPRGTASVGAGMGGRLSPATGDQYQGSSNRAELEDPADDHGLPLWPPCFNADRTSVWRTRRMRVLRVYVMEPARLPSCRAICLNLFRKKIGGESGIRTHGHLAATRDFQSRPIGLSGISP